MATAVLAVRLPRGVDLGVLVGGAIRIAHAPPDERVPVPRHGETQAPDR
jgi:hypothetical protein